MTAPEYAQIETGALVGSSEKYLTFNLGQEQYGVEILKVKEIIGLMEITKVPRTPDFVCGVINLRGKVIPIIKLRNKFDLKDIASTEQTCVIVVEINFQNSSLQMGIIVDSVSEVLDINRLEIEDTPAFGASISTNFIKGMAKTE
ncbi:MAG: purine-binding chemotaxis protein CheW, partial [Deltaproteobacteria bacterium]|nr:purine-binding chemotaxis protein CheW [Deltaproteobacteria bacterium]